MDTTHSILGARVSLRPLALPAEHGGWGLLLEAVVLALLVAPTLSGSLIGVGAVAVFLMRHPLKLAARDWLHRRRYPRSRACELLTAGYFFPALVAFGLAWRISGGLPLIALAAAMPFAALQFAYDVHNRSRDRIAEISGAIAPAAIAMAIALAAAKPAVIAVAMPALFIGRALPAVLYVRALLRGESRALMLISHAAAIALAALLWTVHAAPVTSIVAMLLLLLRAIPHKDGARPQTVGVREIGWGVLTISLIAIGYAL